jgi:hypothetical protein
MIRIAPPFSATKSRQIQWKHEAARDLLESHSAGGRGHDGDCQNTRNLFRCRTDLRLSRGDPGHETVLRHRGDAGIGGSPREGVVLENIAVGVQRCRGELHCLTDANCGDLGLHGHRGDRRRRGLLKVVPGIIATGRQDQSDHPNTEGPQAPDTAKPIRHDWPVGRRSRADTP